MCGVPLIFQSIDCANRCDGRAYADLCGVCSGGSTRWCWIRGYSVDHVPNSDMDCMGVCFGSYSGECRVQMRAENSTLRAEFGYNEDEWYSTVDYVIHNESEMDVSELHLGPFAGSLISYTSISNSIPPFLAYEFFLLENGTLVSKDPENLLFYGNATLVVRLTSSIRNIILYPNQYLQSHQFRTLTVKLPKGYYM